MSNIRLWGGILLAMTVCLLIPLCLLGWLNYTSSRELAREEITQTALPLTRDNIYSEIHSDLMEPIHVATTMANDSFLKDWARGGEKDIDAIRNYLYQIHRKYGFFSVFFVSAQTQKYYHFRGLNKVISADDSHDVWYFEFLNKSKEYVLDVDTDEVGNNELTIFLNFRVEDAQDHLLGVTGVGMKMDTVSRLLKSTGSRYGRQVFLVNRDGVVQAHQEPALIHKANIREMAGIRDIAGEILKNREQVTNLEYAVAGGKVFVTSRFMPELDWFLVVVQDERHMLSSAWQGFVRTLVFGILIWLALVLVIAVAANRYHSRLELLARLDALTRLGNRLQFESDFAAARSRYLRNNEAISLLMLDLDGFKAVNDELGHLRGDEFLRAVGFVISSTLRPCDRAARWGGDEFVILASCAEEQAKGLAGRLRDGVRECAQRLGELDQTDALRKVSVSCGVAQFRGQAEMEQLLHQADRQMYRCKGLGGNGVCAEDSAGQSS